MSQKTAAQEARRAAQRSGVVSTHRANRALNQLPRHLTRSVHGTGGTPQLPRIRLHDLRHTHATIGLRAGVPIKVMSERLGHSTPAFTMQQCAHVIPGMQAEAAAAIADLVRRQGTSS